MDSLRARLKAARKTTAHGLYFISETSLREILDENAIRSQLSDSGISVEVSSEVLARILGGALALFGILIRIRQEHLIVDCMSNGLRDSKLPVGPEATEGLNLDAKFFTRQWEFLAPVFRRSNVLLKLKDSHVLPFISDQRISTAKGGYAKAYRVTLPARHQELLDVDVESEDVVVFRKELKGDTDEESLAKEFRDEDRILKMLNTLNNGSIVQLLISYKHKGVYNFLFPLAEMDLAGFMTATPRPAQFQDDVAIIRALHALSTAIAAVHDFNSEVLRVEFNGCHHDLKPQNILVSGKSFLLADFGITRFKPVLVDSKSISKNVGDYLAPECRGPEKKRQLVGRKSDVWSFGCIMVELLAYMTGGCEAVTTIREMRFNNTDNWKTHFFHNNGSLNAKVRGWLESLSSGGPANHALMVDLILHTLHQDPNRRPNSQMVQRTLRCLYAKYMIDDFLEQYKHLAVIHTSAHLFFDSIRLKSWAFVVGIFQITPEWTWKSCKAELLSDSVLAFLDEANVKLQAVSETIRLKATTADSQNATAGAVVEELGMDSDSRDLHNAIERLFGLLPPTEKQISEHFLINNLLIAKEPTALTELGSTARQQGGLASIPAMVDLKRAVQIADNEGSAGPLKNRLPEGSKVSNLRGFVTYDIGKFCMPDGTTESVLIEWRPFYSPHGPSAKLLQRVDASVNIPNVDSKPLEIRVLECIGFYEDAHRRSFGILYRLPHRATRGAEEPLDFQSLFELIESTSNTLRGKPYLGQRFDIARAVTACISYCHSTDWLHKSLNSHNVVFCRPVGTRSVEGAGLPYIVGFNHSRQDRKDEPSHGPPTDPSLLPYLHPEYLVTRRFMKLFDYYSVGLVLLEIGIWKTIKSIQDSYPFHDSEGLRKELISRHLPEVAYQMGEIYCRVVKACLDGSLGGTSTSEEEVVNAFQALVIGPLQRCVA